MAVTAETKTKLLFEAVGITKAAAGGTTAGGSALAKVLEDTYRKLLELAEEINKQG